MDEAKIKLHPEAIKSFNQKADELLIGLTNYPNQQSAESSFKPDIHVAAAISEKDIIGEIKIGLNILDQDRKIIGRFFEYAGNNVGLMDESYKNLVRIAETIQKSKALANLVSIELIADLIFDWIQKRVTQKDESLLMDYVLKECEGRIKEIEIWLPISRLHIESEIEVGRITFKTITREMMDYWQSQNLSQIPSNLTPEEIARINQAFERERFELQGFAAATIKLLAEPQRASELAFEEAEKSISILRFHSPANLSPYRVSYCTFLGKEKLETERYLLVEDGKIVWFSVGAPDNREPSWRINNEKILQYRRDGLDVLSQLLKEKKRTNFQSDVLNAVLLYSKSSLSKDYSDKLVYILVALESLLLKDSNESIQKSLAERMAVLIGTTLDKRLAVIKNVIDTYKLRSSFIHHGKSIGIDAVQVLKEFMFNTWFCLYIIIKKSVNRFAEKSDFIETIERIKLSGGMAA